MNDYPGSRLSLCYTTAQDFFFFKEMCHCREIVFGEYNFSYVD